MADRVVGRSELIPFRRAALAAHGFEGFVRFAGIERATLPDVPGVYVVLREKEERPAFLGVSPAGHFKGADPTVSVAELEAGWVKGAHCLYIGKATAGSTGRGHLRRRLWELRRYGDGHAVGHAGGRRIWQLTDADQFLVAWRLLPTGDPDVLETQLLRGFVALHGKRPLGNRTKGART